jgi:hypothetical protein
MKMIGLLQFGAKRNTGQQAFEELGVDNFGASWGVEKRMEECVHYLNGEVPKLVLNAGK